MQSALPGVLGPKEVHPEGLQGKVAVVTGGANGIGYEISRALAHGGCKVVMVNRKEDQGKDAIAKIKEETPGADVDWKECDLGNLKQVKEVFTNLRESLDRLDYLALSAGINTNPFDLDHDGIDRHFGVNYLGQYYATNLLWPLIRKTSKLPGAKPPRVVFESSEMHRGAPSDVKFESLDEINTDIGPTRLYNRTKLALILFSKFGLLEKVIKPHGDNIYTLSVHPGTVATNMQEQWKDAYPGITGKLLSWAMKVASRDVEQGAYSALWALTAPEVEEKNWNGWYLSDPGVEGKETAQANDKELGDRLWNLSEKIVKEKVGEDALEDWSSCA